MDNLSKKDWAELIGTAVLVYLALITMLGAGILGGPSLAAAMAIPFFLVYLAFHKISGGHFNPAITMAYQRIGKIDMAEAQRKMMMQGIGAVAAFVLIWLTAIGLSDFDSFKPPKFGVTVSDGYFGVLLTEATFTALFVYMFMLVSANDNITKFKGVAIAGTLLVLGLISMGIGGVSTNPLTSILGGVFDGKDGVIGAGVYLAGATGGAFLAAMIWDIFHGEAKPAAPAASTQTHTPPAVDPTPPPAAEDNSNSDNGGGDNM